jgi:predicted PurR-regulated permease PerM
MRDLGLGRIGQLALVVTILALGKPVLLPVALAFYLAFVLTPPADWLERLGLPRPLSLVSVVGAALLALGVLFAVLMAQAADLAQQMQTYSVQMGQKLVGLRDIGFGVFGNVSGSLAALSENLGTDPGQPGDPLAVRVVSGSASPVQQVLETLGPVVQPIAVAVVVVVMTIFMLGHREDLRGRLIQLVGTQNLTLATRTMAEAVNRVSHLLLTQAYINASFSSVIALGLYLIGIPYAVLWGVVAGLLRFVPMFGAVIAVVFPTAIAFAVFPGWTEVLLTIGLFLVADAVVANFIEPWVLGKRSGISAIALLISALFWTWLWGPMGLLLATPLTVCAAVLGRHVRELSFLAIALGDDAGLNAEINFYQRTLARATKDAHRLAKRRLAESSLPATFDELVVPALSLMVADQGLKAITADVANRVVQDAAEIVDRLSASDARTTTPEPQLRIVGIPAESSADRLLLKMLQVALGERARSITCTSDTDRGGALARVIAEKADVVCVAALPPSGNANARFLCRRIRSELPNAHIVVLLPEPKEKRSREAAARLRGAGANAVVYEIREAAHLLAESSQPGSARAAR